MTISQETIWDEEYLHHGMKWKKERLTLPADLKGKRVLEIGVGNGKNLPDLFRQGPSEITAIDISEVAIEQCKQHFQHPHLRLKKMDLLQNSLKSESFDVILCYYVLNNLLVQERQEAVAQIHRLLATHGRVFFEDFAVGDLRARSKALSSPEPNTLIRKNGLRCHFFTTSELKKLFSAFKQVSISTQRFVGVSRKPSLKRNLLILTAQK